MNSVASAQARTCSAQPTAAMVWPAGVAVVVQVSLAAVLIRGRPRSMPNCSTVVQAVLGKAARVVCVDQTVDNQGAVAPGGIFDARSRYSPPTAVTGEPDGSEFAG